MLATFSRLSLAPHPPGPALAPGPRLERRAGPLGKGLGRLER